MLQLKSQPRRLLTALLLGALSVTAFAPLGLFPIIIFTLAGLFGLLDGVNQGAKPLREGALIGGAFGIGFFITGVSWVFVSLSTFGGMPLPLAAIATFLFCALLAAFPALAGAAFTHFSHQARWRRALAFAALWTLAEILRGWIFTGFPWLAVVTRKPRPAR